MPKAMTLRLDEERARELEATARADGVPVADAVRTAIEEHIERRRQDNDFRNRVRRIVEEDREVLERLASM